MADGVNDETVHCELDVEGGACFHVASCATDGKHTVEEAELELEGGADGEADEGHLGLVQDGVLVAVHRSEVIEVESVSRDSWDGDL